MKPLKPSHLAEQLEAFGLNPTEAAIYLHLVNKQPKSILEIARDLNMPRTSIYDNAVKLAEKGLVQKIVTFKSRKLQAYPIDILQATVDKQKSRADELQQKLSDLQTGLIQTLAVPTNTEARYFYGSKGFEQMMWNSLKADGEMIGYSQFGRAEVVGQKFIERQGKEILKRNIKDRVITNPLPSMLKYLTTDESSGRRKLYQKTRIISADRLYVSGDTTIYNNIFAVAYWSQGEVVGVEIENAELVKTQRSIFEILWNIAEPVENYLPNK